MANEWNKSAFVEFETMLRRHLKSGAAPVAACAGFDLDAASSYLEGALGGPHLASYESHLAGCAMCRRHLIELARLAQAAPRFETRPAAPPDKIPAWNRWKGSVAGWFDLSTWNLKWQIAGAAGAAFMILIAALGAQTLRQASNQAIVARRDASASSPASGLVVQPSQSPAPEPSPQEAAMTAGNLIASNSDLPRSSVPAPSVGPKVDAPDVTVAAPSRSLALPLNQPSEAPVTTRSDSAEAKPSPPPQPRTFIQLNNGEPVSVFEDFGGDSRQLAANETVQDPRDMARYQSRLMESRPESRPKGPGTRSRLRLPDIKVLSLPELVKRSLAPFSKSDSDTESERNARRDKQEAADNGTPKPMQIVIRDKTFCYEKCKGPDLEKIRGMWVDREYDFEKQKWNIWTLPPDSEAYKQVLRDEPLLKEFFDHGPILIVWKNRIYKVLK
jgi:hypothetical protein